MAVGSVRLPELKQEIKVDTKDLDRAIAAAKRFKTEMERSLRVDAAGQDRSFADLENRINRMSEANRKLRASTDEVGQSFRRQTGDIDSFASSIGRAESAIRSFRSTAGGAFNIDTSKWQQQADKVAATMRSLTTESRELLTSQRELGEGFRNTRDDASAAATAFDAAAAAAARLRAALAGSFDIDTSKWESSAGRVRSVIRELTEESRRLLTAQQDLGAGFRRTRQDAEGTASTLNEIAAAAARARAALSGSFDIDTSRWQSQTSGVLARIRELSDATETLRGHQVDLGGSFRQTRDDANEAAAALTALAAAARAVSSAADAGFNIDTSSWMRQTSAVRSRLAELLADTRDLVAGQEDLGAAFRNTRDDANQAAAAIAAMAAAARALDGAGDGFNIDTSRWMSQTAQVHSRLRELLAATHDLVAGQHDLGAAFRATREDANATAAALTALAAAARGANAELGRGFNIDTSRWRSQVQDARQVIQGLRDDTTDAAAAAEMLGAAMRDMRGDLNTSQSSLAALAAEARKFSRAINSAFNIDTSEWRAQVSAVRDMMRGLADDSDRVLASQQRLGAAFRQARAGTDDHSQALQALRVAAEAVSGSIGRLEDRLGEIARSSERTNTSLTRVSRNISNLARFTSLGSRSVSMFSRAIGGLAIAGTVAGGIGVLGGGVVGLAAAVGTALPAAIGLTGALGGLGVTVAGLKAIFSSNEGLEPAVKSLQNAFAGMQDDLQRRVNPAIIELLKQVEGLAPMVRRNIPAFADAFNELTEIATGWLRDSGFQRDLELILQSGIRQFRIFGEAGINAFRGIIGLAAETGPFVERIGRAVNQVAIDFRNWVDEARRTGELNSMLEHSTRILERLGAMVRDLVIGFKDLFRASNFAGFTDAVTATLAGIAADFREFTAERQADLVAMFQNLSRQVYALRPLFAEVADSIRVLLTNIELRPLIEGIIQILPSLTAGLTEAANAAARIGLEAAPAITSLLDLIRAVIPDVERIATAFIQQVQPAIEAVRPGVERFAEMLARISEDVAPVLGGVLRNLGAAASGLATVLAPVGELIGNIVGLLGDMSGVAGMALTALLAFRVVSSIFGGAAAGANRLWTGLQNVATGATAANTNIGLLRRATAGLAQPFAAAAVGAGRLVTSTAQVIRGNEQLITSQSGLIRGLGTMREAYQTTSGRIIDNWAQTRQAAEVSGTATAGVLGRIATDLNNTAGRFNAFAVNAQSSGRTVSGAFNGAAGAVTGAMGTLVGALNNAGGQMTRLGAVAAGTGSAIARGLGTALTGIVGALGGPWGVAITGAITALGMMSTASQQAAARQQEMRGALEQANGAIDNNVIKIVEQRQQQQYAADGARELGVSTTELARATAEGGVAYDQYIAKLREGADSALPEWLDLVQELMASMGSEGAQRAQLIQGMEEQRQQIEEMQAAYRAQQEELTRNEQAMTAQQRAARDVTEGFNEMRQAAGDVEKSVDGLSRALDGLAGTSRTLDEANRDVGEAFREAAESAQRFSGQAQIVNGDLNEGTEAGAAMYDAMQNVREALLTQAKAAFDAAGGTSNLTEAQRRANEVLAGGRDQLLEVARQFTNNEAEAQRYVDTLLAIPPEVLTQILADPARAEQIVTDWRNRTQTAPPVPVQIGGDPRPLEDTVRGAGQDIRNAPPVPHGVDADIDPFTEGVQTARDETEGAPPAGAPVGANLEPFREDLGNERTRVEAVAASWKIPLQANFAAMQEELGIERTRIEEAGAAWSVPFKANFAELQRMLGEERTRIEGAGAAWAVPFRANFDELQRMLGDERTRIEQGERWRIPFTANFDELNGELERRRGEIEGRPIMVPIAANIDRLNQQYNEAFNFISNTIIYVPLAANIDRLNQQYNELFNFISNTVIIAPIAGDFSQLAAEYDRIVQMISSTPVYIPIYGMFMGLAGGGIGGGGGGGAPAGGGGGMQYVAEGGVFDYFASGGMSQRDRNAMKAMLGGGVSYNAGGSMRDQLFTSMGLTPMSANSAQIVPPNTWRVIGDRAVGDEAFIPINNSPRSMMLLEETARRMGYAVEKMAAGGFGNAATSTTSSGPSDGGYTSVKTENNTAAPLVGGDLVVTVPQDTPVQDAMDEITFTLRQMQRGGVHRRTKVRGR